MPLTCAPVGRVDRSVGTIRCSFDGAEMKFIATGNELRLPVERGLLEPSLIFRDGEYFMLDLEGVKIRRLSRDNRIVNLAQLNASLSNAVTVKDRLRFFHVYATDEKLSRNQRQAIFEKIWEISKTKTTKYYDLDLEKLRP